MRPTGTSSCLAPAVEHVDCTSCGGTDHAEIGRSGPWGVRWCARCGMRFVSPRPPVETTASIYDEHYFDGTGAYGNRSAAGGYQGHASGYAAHARQLVRWFVLRTGAHPGRWLDVGCGPGYLVAAANQAGFTGIGVDISAAAVIYGRQFLRVELHQAPAEKIAETVSPAFDVVSMVDTLFHLREPRIVLTQVYSLLGPAGYLLAGPFDLTRPGESLACGEENRDVRGWGIPEHLSFVNQRSMSYLLNDLGFVELQFLPMPRTPSDVGARLRFLPSGLAQPLRKALRRFPLIQDAAHALASQCVNPDAGFVLARKPESSQS